MKKLLLFVIVFVFSITISAQITDRNEHKSTTYSSIGLLENVLDQYGNKYYLSDPNICTASPIESNLVLNGNFETYSSLPLWGDEISKACGWHKANNATPDYMHSASTNSLIQVPCNNYGVQSSNNNNGNAYAAMLSQFSQTSGNYFESIYTKLASPLLPNTIYNLSFDVSLMEGTSSYVNKLQAYFSKTNPTLTTSGDIPITNPAMLFTNPTFSTVVNGWETITFSFTTGSTAGEQYLYLGALNNITVAPNTPTAATTGCIFSPFPIDSRQTSGYYIDNVSLTPSGANNVVYTTKLRNDGKIIFGGDFTSYNGSSINRIARLNSDMSIDPSFVVGSGANNTVKCSAVTGTNAVIIGGLFSSYNGITANKLARLNDDGSFDTGFTTGTGFSDPGIASINCIAPIAKGKMYVGGNFNNYNGTLIVDIAKINADGSLDTTFSSAFTGTSGTVTCIATQSDGKILVAGDFTTYGSNSSSRIVRLNTNGTLDTTFNIGTGFDAPVNGLKIQPDGKILACGTFNSYNGTNRVGMVRLNTDGSLDTTFLTGVIGSGSTILLGGFLNTVDLQSDGKIIVSGGHAGGSILSKLSTTGSVESSYGSGYKPTFDPFIDEGTPSLIRTFSIQPDGKIITGGYFTSLNNINVKNITRLDLNTGVVGKTISAGNKTNSEDYFANSITIYPNPTNDLVTISTNGEDIKTIMIVGIDGKLIANQNIAKSSSCQFNMGNYQNGIYILTVETVNGTIYREKIIKN